MDENLGLRERKKLQTAQALRLAAVKLFTECGFDNVSVAQIAEAAGVSKMTAFNYFPSKEDLLLKPLEEHTDEPARVIRECLAGDSGLRALHEFVRTRVEERDPIVGMSDSPQVLAVYRLVVGTPSLSRRAGGLLTRGEELVADELRAKFPEMVSRVAAAQIISVLRALRVRNLERLLEGEASADIEADALADVDLAFEMLQHGLGDYLDARG